MSDSDPQLMKELVISVFLGAPGRSIPGLVGRLRGRLNSTNDFQWKPEVKVQLQEGRKRLDICLYIDGAPALAIENKVRAMPGPDQLETYGRWLKANVGNRAAALVFLTHWTQPPPRFLDAKENRYGVSLRTVCRWTEVFDWLDEQLRQGRFGNDFTQGLAKEFCGFLKERHMNSISKKDVLALGQALGAAQKIQPFFAEVRRQVEPKMKDNHYVFPRRLDPWISDPGAVEDYCYFKERDTGWYIQWDLPLITKDFLERNASALTHLPFWPSSISGLRSVQFR
jgi:hypothetical protein